MSVSSIANDNNEKVYEVWWEGDNDDDHLIAIFLQKSDAQWFIASMPDNEEELYYIEEVDE